VSENLVRCRQLGGLNVKMSALGLGCASAWGQTWFDETTAIAIVRRALECGATVFDTGPSYSNGNAEPRLNKALRGTERDKLLISTKVGTHIANNGKLFHDLTPRAILRSIDASRRRLDLDIIPLLYLHGLRKEELRSPLLDTLAELRDKGLVRWMGVNSFDTEILELLSGFPMFDVVMLDYNVLSRRRDRLVDRLSRAGKFIVAGVALANHLYSPGFFLPRTTADMWYSLRALKNYRLKLIQARRYNSMGTYGPWSRGQMALAYVLSNPNVGTAMFSTTRLMHLEENIAACGLELPDLWINQIRSLQA
jgi:aryl-alcohol dehydrogenase-like predicted oxidoreductase